MALIKMSEGRLEKITELGVRSQEEWSNVPKGGRDTPTIVFAGTYTIFVIATNKGHVEKTYEGTLLPDSINNTIEIYEQHAVKRHGRGPFSILEDDKRTTTPSRIQVYDKTLDRWYR